MSLGSDFIGGFSAVQDVKARKAKLAQDERLSQADAQLRRDLMQKQIDSDVQRMREGFGHSSTEADKDRSWRTGERTGSETFTAGQNTADRTFRTSERLGGQEFAAGQQTNAQNFSATQQRRDQDFRGGQADKDRIARDVDNAAQNIFRDRQLKQQEIDTALRRDIMKSRLASQSGTFGQPTATGAEGTGATQPLGNTTPEAPKGPGMWDRMKSAAATVGESWRARSQFGSAFDAAHNAQRKMDGAQALPGLSPLEGKIVEDPTGQKYRIVNGQKQPL